MKSLKRRFNRAFVATLGFFLLTHGGHFYAADNYTVYLTARAIVEGGTLEVERGLATAPGRGGGNYGVFGIGQSLLEVPLISAGSLADSAFPDVFTRIVGPNVSVFYPENFAVFGASLLGPLAGALAAAEFWAIAELLGYSLNVVAWLTVMLVASTQFWPAARDSFPHVVVACCLLVAVCHAIVSRDARFKPAPIVSGCAAGLLILVRAFDAALSLPPLALYLLKQDWRRIWQERRLLDSNLGRFLIPTAIAVALVGIHNTLRFGDPMTFNESAGFTVPLSAGLYGLLLSTQRGIIFFSPPVLATLPGLILLWRRRPAEAALLAALIVFFPVGYATYSHWHGDLCWGPRYILPAVPFAVLALGELLEVGGVVKILILSTGLAGLLVQLAGTMVDFQRIAAAGLLPDPTKSQILVNWRALLAGKYLDWMPLRLYAVHGLAAALLYAAAPLAMLAWGTVSLSRLLGKTTTAPEADGR